MNIVEQANPADEIIPGLWLGSRYAALDRDYLAGKKIRTVFNCTKNIEFDTSVTRRYRIPVDDNLQEAEIRNLELWSFEIVYKISSELRRAQADNTAVLVHCAAGMQRSAASVAMYLVAMKNMTTDEAMAFIQSKRDIAFTPRANFEKSIRGFERTFNAEVRPQLQT